MMESTAISANFIFPEEVWAMIFDHLDNPQDIKACYESCQLFKDMLYRKRTAFLFNDAFPLLYKHLPSTTILCCRQVCRSWQKSVDTSLQKDYQHHDKIESPREHYLLRSLYKFQNVEQLERFIQHYDSHAKSGLNPFFTRHVVFDDTALDSYVARRYWEVAGALLEKFGSHIWRCELHVEAQTFAFLYKNIIAKCVSHTPNVTSLTIFSYCRNFMYSRICAKLWQREMTQAEATVREHPLPKLRHLTELKISHLPQPIMNSVMEAFGASGSSQVKRLQVVGNFKVFERFEYKCNEIEGRLPILEELELPSLCTKTTLMKLKSGNWPLTKLNLLKTRVVEKSESSAERITFSKLHHVLNTFGQTLCHLHVHLVGYATLDSESALLQLPHLESLQLTIDQGVMIETLDFAFQLKSLKQLTIVRNSSEFPPQIEMDVQLAGFQSRMKESNVWKLLPELKVIKVRDVTRGEMTFLRPVSIASKIPRQSISDYDFVYQSVKCNNQIQ